ncbi:MAG: DUF1015 family protein [Elusimicrobia bacterium]|nr:DUF1015 family protein [Elusimicrobiota bacterium]
MITLHPFRAIRFNASKIPLSRALCPPYDAISSSLGRRLRKYPANAIHLELPEGQGDKKYKNALQIWRDWRSQRILQKDPQSGFYLCEQVFPWKGKKF